MKHGGKPSGSNSSKGKMKHGGKPSGSNSAKGKMKHGGNSSKHAVMAKGKGSKSCFHHGNKTKQKHRNQKKRVTFAEGKHDSGVRVGKECPDLIDWFDVVSKLQHPDKIQAFYQLCQDQNIIFHMSDNPPIPRSLYISFSADESKKCRKRNLKIPTI